MTDQPQDNDAYPESWGYRPNDKPVIEGRRISDMRSGCPDTTGWNEHPDVYPQEWRR
jgi:hypothetical protein